MFTRNDVFAFLSGADSKKTGRVYETICQHCYAVFQGDGEFRNCMHQVFESTSLAVPRDFESTKPAESTMVCSNKKFSTKQIVMKMFDGFNHSQ